jgi:hypothetical protein
MATFRCRDLSAAADLGLDVRWGRYYVPRWSNTAKIMKIEGQRRRRRVNRKRQKPPVRVTPNKPQKRVMVTPNKEAEIALLSGVR